MMKHKGFLTGIFSVLLVFGLVLAGCGGDDDSPGTPQAAKPTASPGAGAVGSGTQIRLSTATSGASIYYTLDDTDPDDTSSLYSDSSSITIAADTTIKAIAVKAGMTDSAVLEAAYTVDTDMLASPTATPAGGAVKSGTTVTLSAAGGATIHYTEDGSEPTASSTQYTAGTTIIITAAKTIKAIAVQGGKTDSAVMTAAYTIAANGKAATPTASPGSGAAVTSGTTVTLETTTDGADIYYTIDGNTPNKTTGTKYSGPITIESGKTIKAIAVKAGLDDSEVLTAKYTIDYGFKSGIPSNTILKEFGVSNLTGVDTASANGYMGYILEGDGKSDEDVLIMVWGDRDAAFFDSLHTALFGKFSGPTRFEDETDETEFKIHGDYIFNAKTFYNIMFCKEEVTGDGWMIPAGMTIPADTIVVRFFKDLGGDSAEYTLEYVLIGGFDWTQMQSVVSDNNWNITLAGSNAGYATGEDAETIWAAGESVFASDIIEDESGEEEGSFEDLLAMEKDDVSPPAALITALKAKEKDAPLVGFFTQQIEIDGNNLDVAIAFFIELKNF
jgi:hypothetical protein